MGRKKPYPTFFDAILERIVPLTDRESLAGDFAETFDRMVKTSGIVRAYTWYILCILRLLPTFLLNSFRASLAMFRNYMKVASRTIRRHKGYAFINMAGLSVGMTCCILMLLWVQDEVSWDRFHEHGDDIYRVIARQQTKDETILNARTPDPLLPTLMQSYPEIIDGIRFQGFSGWSVTANGKSFTNDDLGTADPSFFRMFSFTFIHGDAKTALDDRYSIVLTESMAKKYFGDVDAMGKIVDIGLTFRVTGVIEDVPENSHIHFDGIFPIINMEDCWEEDFTDWDRIAFYTYVRLHPDASAENVQQKMANTVRAHRSQSNIKSLFLQPLHRVHLYSKYQWDLDNYKQGNITYVTIFAVTALCILIVACINFMNLVTARAGTRAKEIGMRKVTGAHRKNIIVQFFHESLLLAFLSLIIAVFLTMMFLPVFNDLTDKSLTVASGESGWFLLGLGGITLFTGIVSASYPAFFLAAFRPVKILKGSFSSTPGNRSVLRKALVIVQFWLTSLLIIGTIVVYRQVHFMLHKDLGFEKEHILYFPAGAAEQEWPAMRQALLQNPRIHHATNSYPPNGRPWAITDIDWEGKSPDEKLVVYPYGVDVDYLNTFQMEMVSGRFFSERLATDSAAYVINESAARAMGMHKPVGKRLSLQGRTGTIIGVIRDFHQSSLHGEIEPLVLVMWQGAPYTCVKIDSEDMLGTLAYIEEIWNRFSAEGHPFQYEFLDQSIDRFYKNEKKLVTIFQYFTLLLIFIACLGLYGLALFTAEQRTKEIGIRKVLGASMPRIVMMLSEELTKWVLVANVIAWPVAYVLMHRWLQSFAYRTDFDWWIFMLAGGVALFIALATVSAQAVKAGLSNPVNSLTYE
jgi:putative ABC transport system permease protein